MKLIWKRDKYSGHWAYGTDLGYQLSRDGKRWRLTVRRVAVTGGVRHTLGQETLHIFTEWFDTLAEAKTVLQFFEDAPSYDMHKAIMRYHAEVTQPRIDRIRAEYDALLQARTR